MDGYIPPYNNIRDRHDSHLSQQLLDQHNVEQQLQMQEITSNNKSDTSAKQCKKSDTSENVKCIKNELKYSHTIYSSKESFFIALMKWIITTLIIILCIVLSPIFVFISITIFFWPLINILKLHYIILLILLCLPSLYGLFRFYNVTISSEISAFYSLIPTIASILFKDAVIFTSQFKYIAERIFNEGELAYYLNFRCCEGCLCLHHGIICCYCCGIPMLFSLIHYCGSILFSKLLAVFVRSYHVWGVTLNDYIPCQQCTVRIENTWSTDTEIRTMSELLPIVHESGFNLAPIYSNLNKCFKYIMLCFIWIPIIIPYVYVFMNCEKLTSATMVLLILGIIATTFVFVSINQFIEVIFYRLIKYYSYMNRMTELITIPQAQIRGDVVIDIAGNFVTEGSLGSSNMSSAKIDVNFRCNQKKQVNIKKINVTIYLWENENSIIWFENWCRIETVASLFFENKKSIIFAIFSSLIGCSIWVVYYYFGDLHGMESSILFAVCIILYFFLLLLRLLFWAMKFSKLQSCQIESLECQKIRIKQLMFVLNKSANDKDVNDIQTIEHYRHYTLVSRFLDDVITGIQRRSVSPKIAGIKLDEIMVKLIFSSFIGMLLSALSFYLRSR